MMHMESTNHNQQRIVEKVRKLLALSSSSNVHEAALAALRAQELIDKHRLTASLTSTTPSDEQVTDGRQHPLFEGRRIRKWKAVLAAGLATLNGCVAYTDTTASPKRILVVGNDSDREMVFAMWEPLVHQIEWLSATHLQGKGRDKRWHDAFRIGAVETIVARLQQARTQNEHRLTNAHHSALMRSDAVRRDAVERFAAQHLNLRKGRRILVDPHAHREGKRAGQTMPLPRADKPQP